MIVATGSHDGVGELVQSKPGQSKSIMDYPFPRAKLLLIARLHSGFFLPPKAAIYKIVLMAGGSVGQL